MSIYDGSDAIPADRPPPYDSSQYCTGSSSIMNARRGMSVATKIAPNKYLNVFLIAS
jgi:hypothetical protein